MQKDRIEYSKQYRKNNKEKIAKQKRQYYLDNQEKIKERSRQWHLDNPEHRRQYYLDNQEKEKEYRRQHYTDNQKKERERNKQYRIDNGEKLKEHYKQYYRTEAGIATAQRGSSKRRSILKNITNTLTAKEWLDILREHNYRCAYCKVEFTKDIPPTRDHVIPISKGGHNIKENIVPACQSCNSKKYNKII